MDTVIVTGVRQSLTQGLENKREAAQVIESIVAEDIGKLPDNNVIEALQRVTGVQITNRGGGEPATTAPIPASSSAGCRTSPPPGMAATYSPASAARSRCRTFRPTSSAASTCSRPAPPISSRQGLAGQIDVRTRRPFDLPGFEMSFLARATQQEQRDDSLDPNVSFLVVEHLGR